jgi:hypothetical protein
MNLIKKFWLFLFLGIIFFVNTSFILKADWQLKKNKNGIKVYTKTSENSPIKEVKCITNFNSTLSGLVAFIKDIPAHTQYIYKCKSAFVIRHVNDTNLYYYHETETPWPVVNRYGVINYKIYQNKNTKQITINSVGVLGIYPKQNNKVEVEKLIGYWIFTPLSNGTVNGEYYLFLNPGGEIPSWIINFFVTDGPYLTILKMKDLLMTKTYQQAKFHFIQN